MVATVLPTGFESRHRQHMWVSQEVLPQLITPVAPSPQKNKAFYFQFDLEPTN